MTRTGTCLRVDLGATACPFSRVTRILGQADVRIDGFSVQATEDGAIAYLVPEDVSGAQEALDTAGIAHVPFPFVAGTVTSPPGTLGRAMARLDEEGISVEAAFLVTTPWGPDLQVAFATAQAHQASSLLEQLEGSVQALA